MFAMMIRPLQKTEKWNIESLTDGVNCVMSFLFLEMQVAVEWLVHHLHHMNKYKWTGLLAVFHFDKLQQAHQQGVNRVYCLGPW